jgi:hypothetical protein
MGAKPGRRNLFLAHLATAVGPFLHLLQSQVDLGEHPRPPVGDREAQLVVGRQRGTIAERRALDLLPPRGRLDAALALLSKLATSSARLFKSSVFSSACTLAGRLLGRVRAILAPV